MDFYKALVLLLCVSSTCLYAKDSTPHVKGSPGSGKGHSTHKSSGRKGGSGRGSSKAGGGGGGGRGTCSARLECCPGLPGPMGPPGQQGTQGIQGVQGVQGTSGVPGRVGPPGMTGAKGSRGAKGELGDSTTYTKIIQPHLTDPTPTTPPAPNIAFSVTLGSDLPMSDEYRVIQLNVVLSNVGGAYDTDTSIFTAPVNGTYLIGFGGVSYHGQNILIHLVKNGQRILSAFDNSGCSCCNKDQAKEKCAGSGSNAGILGLEEGDKLWLIMPDQHGMHNAPYHNYASFYGYLIFAH